MRVRTELQGVGSEVFDVSDTWPMDEQGVVVGCVEDGRVFGAVGTAASRAINLARAYKMEVRFVLVVEPAEVPS